MLIFWQDTAEETPKRLKYMKKAGKMAVVVAQLPGFPLEATVFAVSSEMF